MSKTVIKLHPLHPQRPIDREYTEIFSDYVVHYSKVDALSTRPWGVRFQCRDMAHIAPEYHWQYIDPIWWAGPVTGDGYQTLMWAREDVRRQLFKWRKARAEEKKQTALEENSVDSRH